eukprot:UN06151
MAGYSYNNHYRGYPSHYNEAMLYQESNKSTSNNNNIYFLNDYNEPQQNDIRMDICWDYLSIHGCSRNMCRWRHINNINGMKRDAILTGEGTIINITNDDNVNNDIEIQYILWHIIYHQTVSTDKIMQYTKFDQSKIQNAFKHLYVLGFIEIAVAHRRKTYKICTQYAATNLHHSTNPLMIELQRKFGDFYFGGFEPFKFHSENINVCDSVTETATATTNNYSLANSISSVK